MSYTEPCESRPCMNCKYDSYDAWFDEHFCEHAPPAEGLGVRGANDKWGTCEYWEKRR